MVKTKGALAKTKSKSSITPLAEPLIPEISSPFSQTSNYPKPLTTPEKQKLITREISKLHAQALGRIFGAYGIDSSQINIALSTNLRSEISKQFYNLNPKERAKFITISSLGRATDVGKSTLREGFLTKIYSEFGNNPQNLPHLKTLYESINNSPQKFKRLDKNKLIEFKEFHYSFISKEINKVILPNPNFEAMTKQASPEEQLEASLTAILPNDKKDITNTNIEKAIETLILQNENENEVRIGINSMSATYLATMFGVPSIETMSPAELENFKNILTAYSAKKSIEIAISTNNTRLLENLGTVVKGNKPIIKHLSFASIRDFTKEHGAETTANALNYRRKDIKEEVKKIAEQYKSFFGLWENLSAKEQRIVYEKFNIAYNKNMDGDRKLMFIPEFLFFDVGSLKSFKNNIKPEQQGIYNEFIEANQTYLKNIGEQLIKEERLGQFLRDYYLFSTHEHQILLIADYLANQNSEIVLTKFPDTVFFDQFSANEIANADQYIQDTNYTLSNNGRQFSRESGLGHRIRNSKLGKKLGLKNTNTPSSKMSKALESKLAKKLTSVTNTLPPGFISTFLKIARKIGFKRVAKIIIGTLGALLGGILYLTNRFIPSWLKSIAGMGSSRSAEAAIASNSLTGSDVTNTTAAETISNSSANTAAQATIARATTTKTISAASGIFFGIPIALLAPGITMFIALAVTTYVIFTIQSAFLVPVPKSLDISNWGSANSYKCNAASIPKPTNAGVIMSSDGKYAYPMIKTNYDNVDSCYHWDRTLAIDIFTEQNEPSNPQENLPLVAYTSGRIYSVVPNDSHGGLYIILKGDDERYYYYAHLCTGYVQTNQRVEAGEVIGTTNQSGVNAKVTPEHLHFAIQNGGVQPEFYEGGNVCPFTDIREKFGIASCPVPEWECLPKTANLNE